MYMYMYIYILCIIIYHYIIIYHIYMYIIYYILYNTHSLVWSSLASYNAFEIGPEALDSSPTDESGEGGCHERQGQTSPGLVLVGAKRLAF